MKNTIAITPENKVYANAELDFTHDYSTVEAGSIMINRHGNAYEITEIDTDDCGRRQFWSGGVCLGVQYTTPHNMLTKMPFYAHEFKIKS